jgi:hypothetical protein
MKKKDGVVTADMLEALRRINQYCGRDFAITPVSHTVTRQLAKLGLVFMRVTKVYGSSTAGGDEKKNIVHVRIAGDGANLLRATTGMKIERRGITGG